MASMIPPWLDEHCVRLQAVDSDITNLNLNIRRMDRSMMEALAKALSCNPRIEIVNFTSSFMNAPQENDAVSPLAELLKRHNSLRTVHLSYNHLTSAVAIGRALHTNVKLRELYLDHNHLEDGSAVSLAQGLQHNETLQVLQLESNQIGDAGGVALALALRTNTTLLQLGMSRNRLGVEAGRALLEQAMLDHNTTLTRLLLEENPGIPPQIRLKLQYLVRANQVGRHILGSSSFNINLWPSVLEDLEPNMTYYFLQQKPDLLNGTTILE
jgi:Ran GTPase-activating protein (RanGAP) involved in mRNA processing and transport